MEQRLSIENLQKCTRYAFWIFQMHVYQIEFSVSRSSFKESIYAPWSETHEIEKAIIKTLKFVN